MLFLMSEIKMAKLPELRGGGGSSLANLGSARKKMTFFYDDRLTQFI